MQVKVAERQDQMLWVPVVKADTHLLEQNGGQMENGTASRTADFTGWKPGEHADLCLGPFSSP